MAKNTLDVDELGLAARLAHQVDQPPQPRCKALLNPGVWPYAARCDHVAGPGGYCPAHRPVWPLVTLLAPPVLLTRNGDTHTVWVSGRVAARLPYMEV